MVTTIAWTIYLIFTLIVTKFYFRLVTDYILNLIGDEDDHKIRLILGTLMCILWGIWYMYFLH